MINRDCRCPGCGTCEAAATIEPLKKERLTLRKSLKEEKQRYNELYRMQKTYIEKLHAAEEEIKLLKEEKEKDDELFHTAELYIRYLLEQFDQPIENQYDFKNHMSDVNMNDDDDETNNP